MLCISANTQAKYVFKAVVGSRVTIGPMNNELSSLFKKQWVIEYSSWLFMSMGDSVNIYPLRT